MQLPESDYFQDGRKNIEINLKLTFIIYKFVNSSNKE